MQKMETLTEPQYIGTTRTKPSVYDPTYVLPEVQVTSSRKEAIKQYYLSLGYTDDEAEDYARIRSGEQARIKDMNHPISYLTGLGLNVLGETGGLLTSIANPTLGGLYYAGTGGYQVSKGRTAQGVTRTALGSIGTPIIQNTLGKTAPYINGLLGSLFASEASSNMVSNGITPENASQLLLATSPILSKVKLPNKKQEVVNYSIADELNKPDDSTVVLNGGITANKFKNLVKEGKEGVIQKFTSPEFRKKVKKAFADLYKSDPAKYGEFKLADANKYVDDLFKEIEDIINSSPVNYKNLGKKEKATRGQHSTRQSKITGKLNHTVTINTNTDVPLSPLEVAQTLWHEFMHGMTMNYESGARSPLANTLVLKQYPNVAKLQKYNEIITPEFEKKKDDVGFDYYTNKQEVMAYIKSLLQELEVNGKTIEDYLNGSYVSQNWGANFLKEHAKDSKAFKKYMERVLSLILAGQTVEEAMDQIQYNKKGGVLNNISKIQKQLKTITKASEGIKFGVFETSKTINPPSINVPSPRYRIKSYDPLNNVQSSEEIIQEISKATKNINLTMNPETSSLFQNNSFNNFGNWDLQSSLDWLTNNATSKSTHYCARSVRKALQAGGINMDDRPDAAKDYVGYLETKGFQSIGQYGNTGDKLPDSYNPKAGDIIVIDKNKNHIAMYNGKDWISDFKQKTFHGLSKKDYERYTIYRHSTQI